MNARPLLALVLAACPSAAAAQSRSVQVPVPVVVPLPVLPLPAIASSLAASPAFAPAPLAAPALAPSIPRVATLAPVGELARGSAPSRPARWRPLRLILTGPPGSGKGTYAKRLARDYGPVHLSAGELLREYARNDPGIQAIMNEGRLVPTELVLRLVRERLMRDDVRARGFILDGFPRRLEEARALDAVLAELGMPIDGVVFLEVPEAELLRRILARGRADDNETTFRERMRVYEEQTVPVLEFLRRRAPYLTPEVGSGGPDAAYEAVRKAVEGL